MERSGFTFFHFYGRRRYVMLFRSVREEVQSAADAVRIALEQTKIDEKERNVLLAHQFVTGAKRCDAEELQVGDVDQIPAELFALFEYVALGITIVRRKSAARRCATAVHHLNIRFPRRVRRSRLPSWN